jgi:ligand-binding sensor domain-containing protein/two-component sensor histidine kinase
VSTAPGGIFVIFNAVMVRLKVLFLWLFLSYGLALSARQPSLYFDRLTAQNGLSHNKVNCILRDQRGFMWFGTNDGLNRYDGHNFVIFRYEPGNSASISGNIINDMLEDEQGVLWIATADGGLSRYDYKLPPSKQFKQYRRIPGDSTSIPVNVLNSLLMDRQGYLWIGTSGKALLRFNRHTEKFQDPDVPGTLTITDIAMDHTGTLWVGRIGGGALTVNTRTLKCEMDPRYYDLYGNLPHTTITAVYADDKKNVWFGSWDRVVYRHSTVTGEEQVFGQGERPFSFKNDEISCFVADDQGRLWMGGRNGGLHIYDTAKDRFYNYRYDPAREGTVADNKINCLYKDKDGVIWAGTNKGISIHRPMQQQFEQTFLPPVNSAGPAITIYDFYEQGNDLWIGTSEGIYIRSGDNDQLVYHALTYKDQKLKVTKFFRDVDGTFYVGTDYSLFKLNEHTFTVSLLPGTEDDRVMNKIIDSRVVSILRDTLEGHPVIMVAPYGHFIAYYDLVDSKWVSRRDTVKNIIQRFPLTDNLIRKLYKTRDGQFWMTTVMKGLGMSSTHTYPKMQYFSSNPGKPGFITNDNVYDLVEDATGNLWVSTYGGGLHYFNRAKQQFAHIAATNNLLEGIQTDRTGDVWMVSNGNLHKYNPVLKAYSSFELPDIEKGGGVKGDIFKDNKGDMYMAGSNYFISFDPEQIRETHQMPQVYFTDFKIFNESFSDLLLKDKIELEYDQNYFTVEFAAPDYSAGRNVQYSFLLENRDKRWIESGSRNFLEFSNLSGGDYVLKVRATNNAGVWNDKVATLHITIIPPFWERWWFYALCALLTALIIYAIYRYRINALLKQQAIRNKIAQDLHDNVGSTLSSISVYSQVAKIYHEQERQTDLQQTLEKISDTSGEMISEMNDIVWAINPRHDNMETILQRMESFARPLLAAKSIAFHFSADPAIKQISLEMTRRKNFYLIFKEGVNNALKYSDCKNLWVHIRIWHHQLELEVKDDGAGFDIDKIRKQAHQSLSGNGLRNMEMRAAEMKGVWVLNSVPGQGTTVHLRFPIG